MNDENAKNSPQKSQGEPLSPEGEGVQSDTQFAYFFEEMVDLMQFAIENPINSIKSPLPKDLEESLSQLESDVDLFCRLNAAISSHKSKDAIEVKSSDILAGMSRREKAIFDRSKDLSKKLEKKMEDLKKRLTEISSSGSSADMPVSKEVRKKNFKNFGLRDKWKKL